MSKINEIKKIKENKLNLSKKKVQKPLILKKIDKNNKREITPDVFNKKSKRSVNNLKKEKYNNDIKEKLNHTDRNEKRKKIIKLNFDKKKNKNNSFKNTSFK